MRKCETGANLIEKRFLAISAVLAIGADLDALQKECDGGNGTSCYELGVLYDNAREGAAQDYKKAAELYSKACNLGKGAGYSNLGFLYDNGSGAAQDGKKAADFYPKACNTGDEAGCSNLGYAYANGRGAKQDYAKACDMSNGGGCYNLGNLYAQGRGVKEDANAAEKYLKKAYEMKPELACGRYKEFTQK